MECDLLSNQTTLFYNNGIGLHVFSVPRLASYCYYFFFIFPFALSPSFLGLCACVFFVSFCLYFVLPFIQLQMAHDHSILCCNCNETGFIPISLLVGTGCEIKTLNTIVVLIFNQLRQCVTRLRSVTHYVIPYNEQAK